MPTAATEEERVANDIDADTRPAPGGRGRHRTPGAPPPWLSMARVVLAVIGVLVALWLVMLLVRQLAGGDAENTGGAVPGVDATSETATETTTEAASPTDEPSATTAAPTPPAVASPTATGWSAQGAAATMLAAFEAQTEAAVPGALVLAGKFGDDVDNTSVVVSGEWGEGKLRNGLSVAENHEGALRAGKLTARNALPTATTTAKVAVTRSDVRRLPVQSARDAFGALVAVKGPDCAECQDIIVTGVTSTTTRIATTRGPLIVPAWSFAVQGTKARIVMPALAPTALLNPSPGYRGKVSADVAAGQLPLWRTELSRDGRVFTGYVDTAEVRKRGGCWRMYAAESVHAVAVYAAPGTGEATAPCASSIGKVTVRLAAPLGGRTLLDTYWTRAVAP